MVSFQKIWTEQECSVREGELEEIAILLFFVRGNEIRHPSAPLNCNPLEFVLQDDANRKKAKAAGLAEDATEDELRLQEEVGPFVALLLLLDITHVLLTPECSTVQSN